METGMLSGHEFNFLILASEPKIIIPDGCIIDSTLLVHYHE